MTAFLNCTAVAPLACLDIGNLSALFDVGWLLIGRKDFWAGNDVAFVLLLQSSQFEIQQQVVTQASHIKPNGCGWAALSAVLSACL